MELEIELGLNDDERLQLVQKVVKVLFMTEYAALVEYTEVVTPVIYSMSGSYGYIFLNLSSC